MRCGSGFLARAARDFSRNLDVFEPGNAKFCSPVQYCGPRLEPHPQILPDFRPFATPRKFRKKNRESLAGAKLRRRSLRLRRARQRGPCPFLMAAIAPRPPRLTTPPDASRAQVACRSAPHLRGAAPSAGFEWRAPTLVDRMPLAVEVTPSTAPGAHGCQRGSFAARLAHHLDNGMCHDMFSSDRGHTGWGGLQSRARDWKVARRRARYGLASTPRPRRACIEDGM